MTDYNKENHHHEHHDEISDLIADRDRYEAALRGVRNFLAEHGAVNSDQRVYLLRKLDAALAADTPPEAETPERCPTCGSGGGPTLLDTRAPGGWLCTDPYHTSPPPETKR